MEEKLFSEVGKFSLPSTGKNFSENFTENISFNNGDGCSILITSHDGKDVADTLIKYLKDQFSKPNLFTKTDADSIIEKLKNMFLNFEDEYLQKLNNIIKKRDELRAEISNIGDDAVGLPESMEEYEEIERKLRCGCTLIAVFYIHKAFYIVNIGDNQLIVLQEDDNFQSFTSEHNFYNKSEFERIVGECDINADMLSNLYGKSNSRYHSRCLGHYDMKKEYQQIDNFKVSKYPPIKCDPEIVGNLCYDASWSYFMLISSGLYYLVMDLIYDRDKIVGEIAHEFSSVKKTEPNLVNAVKHVIMKYSDSHKKAFEQNESDSVNYSHEELNFMAVKFNVTAATGSQNDSASSNPNDAFSSLKSLNSSLPQSMKAYVSFDKWNEIEFQMDPQEIQKIDAIISIKEEKQAILEEEESSAGRFSRSTTVNSDAN